MKEIRAVRSRLAGWLVEQGAGRPVVTLSIWLVILVVALAFVSNLKVETSTGSILDREAPEWSVYQLSQDLFGGDEVIVAALEGDRPFDPAVIRQIAELARRMSDEPGVRRVDSVTTVPLIRASGTGMLILEPLVRGGSLPDGVEPRDLVQLYAQDRLAPGNLVSADGRVLAANVILERNADRHYARILSVIRDALGDSARISGVPVFRYLANEETRRQLVLFGPVAVGIVGVGAAAVFGTPWASLAALIPGAFATVLVMGAMGFLGMRVTISTVILPPVLLAIGCAYAVHVFSGLRRGGVPLVAKNVASGVALSSVTTAIGFLGVATVEIQAIRELGIMGSLGALVAGACALSAVPAAVTNRAAGSGVLARWHPPVVRRSLVLFGGMVAVGIGVVGVPRLRVDTDVIRWFPSTHQARLDYEWIREKLSGISPVNLVVSSPGGSVAAPEMIAALERVATQLRLEPNVGRVTTVADPILQLDEAARAGSATSEQVPPGELIEQYLLMLESSPQIRDLITADRRYANLALRLDDNRSVALRRMAARAEGLWAEHGPEGTSATATGIMYEFARAQDEIAAGQLRALAVAGIVIAVILVLVTWRPWVAGVALVANVLPLFAIFGLMGLTGIPVDAGTILVGNLALGIGVDDSIHVIWAYRRQRYRSAPTEAARAAVRDVALPVTVTTAILCVGFGVLGLSELSFTRELGMLTVSVLVMCLLADLWLLPTLLGKPPRGLKG